MSEDWRTADESIAFYNGLAAYEDGESDDRNPYPFKSDNGQAWLMGWDYGFEKYARERKSNELDKVLDGRRS